MTTQINVIVDNGGLSAKAKQQTNANRWAKLEKDGKELVANRASNERENALARVGLDPKGSPLYGSSPQLQVRKDEPAAIRRQEGEYFLLKPTAAPAGSQLGLQHKELISALTVGLGTPTFSANAGPNGSSALVADNPPSGNYVHLTGAFPFDGSLSKYKDGVKDFTLQFFFKFGTTYSLYQDEPDISIRIGTVGYVDVFISLQSRFGNVYAALDCSVRHNPGTLSDGVAGFTELLSTPAGSVLQPGAWHHFAICKSADTVRAFLDGAQIGSTQVSWETIDFAPAGASDWASIYFGISSVQSIPGQPVYLHGLRFDTKAIYKEAFTPPLNL